jgi:3-ketosteroid 9alpha-monooxygenase subunit B
MLVGRDIEITGYAGAYIMPQEIISQSDLVVHLTAGSGVVPSYSIIKDELLGNKNIHSKHKLIFINKTFRDIIFHKDLLELQKKYPDRFEVIHYLTREADTSVYGKNYFSGRPKFVDIKKHINDIDRTLIFACGPAITKWQKKAAKENNISLKPRFMEWVQDVVNELGIDKKRYHREVYG